MGPDWPLELTKDPAVKRNGGLDAHPGVGLEGSELSWAGPGLVDTGSLTSCWCWANTGCGSRGSRLLWHSNPILAYRCLIPTADWGWGKCGNV